MKVLTGSHADALHHVNRVTFEMWETIFHWKATCNFQPHTFIFSQALGRCQCTVMWGALGRCNHVRWGLSPVPGMYPLSNVRLTLFNSRYCGASSTFLFWLLENCWLPFRKMNLWHPYKVLMGLWGVGFELILPEKSGKYLKGCDVEQTPLRREVIAGMLMWVELSVIHMEAHRKVLFVFSLTEKEEINEWTG